MEVFDQMKMKHQYGIVFYKLNDNNTQIVVDKTFGTGTPFNTFLSELPSTECRYALVDFTYTDNTLEKKKLVFVSWCPSQSSIKSKMIYTASKDALKKACVGIQAEIQGCDISEVQEECFIEKINRL
ncbi:hypothetical protein SAMD00019534_087850 [Acytostelium subglobosum LB1]|uniref:hypothetical protein n=1 Tax=Acytostelium subglobosum LB1 TaxID=1410327 RepID=UPI0006448F03|nr:hypothetical protein SAMD00019534_087850 [Acytostelium subglobosum LB1]GAM25610.1 hypothetical protein SAMD00019534_087850 [Acytostelium subglobosum LB1]|eukprot:XP_012751596.1 hypothetical protein SAMD00019534_087850 [Acytostelium subglobosum LB1]